ncbi:exopolysaccharide production protein ExoZ [Novosphingobium fluoreni]|uniref:Exopolysaccharide production protein ExoZ n=1 Tax=Novosphingobium fluoreni TaxID=1391222 RepID=A0A7W6FX57_9SPHN|nr:acyltransferase [Novosphingobium fluoreni]MBB3938913.1 exopolysaccharide production protein ExoZ [Novosphingobium fluoreni]
MVRGFRSIQYLRALAALMVVLHHALTPARGLNLPELRLDFLSAGVDLFFVISGFIIYTSQAGKDDQPSSFAWRRFLRVVPLYWIATIALIVLHFVAGLASDMNLTAYHIVASFLLIPHFSPSHPGHIWPLLIPGWSLFYEIYFYFLFSLAMKVDKRRAPIITASVLIFLVIAGVIIQPKNAIAITFTNPRLLEFFFGLGLGYLARKAWVPECFAVLLPIGLVLLCASEPLSLPRIVSWGGASLLIVAGAVAMEKRTPATRLMLLGDSSYSLYLSHLIVLSIARELWRRIVPAMNSNLSTLIFIFVCMSLSVGAGLLVYFYVERPLLRLSRSRIVPSARVVSS